MAGGNELFADDSQVVLSQYPLWDSFLNGVGECNLDQETQLFSANAGVPSLSNMLQNGQIPGGGLFFCTGLSASAFFMSLADSEYLNAYGTIVAAPNFTTSPARAQDLYGLLSYATTVQLEVDQYPTVIIPWHQIPAGGGPYGNSTVQGRGVITMGMPSVNSAGKFSKPVKIGALSQFTVKVKINPFSQSSKAGGFTSTAQGGPLTVPFSTLNQINQADCIKHSLMTMRGYLTRKLGGTGS